MGGVAKNEVYAYSVSSSSEWRGTKDTVSSGSTCSVSSTGKYKIELYGGNGEGTTDAGGGHIIATAKLSKGDTLKYLVLEGGVAGNAYGQVAFTGGRACIIYLNGTPLVGAGGRDGKGIMYSQSEHPATGVSSVINNALFSSGGGGAFYYGNKYNGGNGNTISGCTPARGGYDYHATTAGTSGSNYLDTSRAVLVSAPNDSARNDCMFSVTPLEVTQADAYGYMVEALSTIAEKMGNGSSNITIQPAPVTVVTPQEAPIFTVIAGESFNLPCNKYDDMQSASANGITVTNTTVGDGCIMVSGKINTEGTYTLSVKGKSFIFYVVKEPNSANVLVKLD